MTPTGHAGERVGRWTLHKLLGTGGFGSTWEARDGQGRVAALKLLAEAPGDELRSLASISHTCVPEVYEGGHLPRPFIAMRLAPGRPLTEWLKASRPPEELALQLTVWLADALATVHRASLTHGDISPSNILVDRVQAGSLALIDFGLAGAGGRGGTLHYGSPEVLQGELATSASDVYGLGLILWELLHGGLPWPQMDLSRALVQRGLEAPSPTAGPDWVRHLLTHMLAPDPTDRPTAGDLVDRFAEQGVHLPTPTAEEVRGRAHRVHIEAPGVTDRVHAWMAQGGPLVVMGREGCGRSHLIARTSEELSARGVPWVRFQAGGRPWSAVSQALVAPTLPGEPASLPEEGTMEERAEAATASLEERGAGSLHVLADDLETLDAPSRAVLTALVERGNASVLVSAEDPPASWCVEPLILGSFHKAMTEDYVRRVLGLIADPETLTRRLQTSTEGVPRDLTRVLVAMVESGALTRRNQHWVLDESLWSPTLEALPPIDALPPLTPTEQATATVLAYWEEPLSLTELDEMFPGQGEELRSALERLEDSGLIQRDPRGFLPRTSGTAKSIRAAYPDARDVHRGLVQHLLKNAPEHTALGWHLLGSGDAGLIEAHGAKAIQILVARDTHEGLRLANALWALSPAPALAAPRVEALVAAGQVERARSVALETLEPPPRPDQAALWTAYAKACLDIDHGTQEALAAVESARTALGHSGPIVLLLIETRAHFEAGDSAAAVACAQRAATTPQRSEDLNDWLTLQGLHAQALHAEGATDDALALLEQIPASLGNTLPARGVVDGMLGRLLWHAGRPREAAQCLETAARNPSMSVLNRARTLNNAALACYQVGDRPGALAKWEDAIAHFERLRANLDMLRVAINLSVGYRELERAERAKKHGHWAVEQAAELGHHELHAVAMGNLGDVYFLEGDGEAAQRWYESAYQLARTHNLTVDAAESARRLARLAIERRSPSADVKIEEALERSKPTETAIEGHRVRALAVWHRALSGDRERVREDLDQILNELRKLGADAELAETRLVASYALHASGRTHDARKHAERVHAWAKEMGHLQLRTQSSDLIENLPSSEDDDDRLNLVLQLAVEVGRERDLDLLLKTVAESALQLLTGDRAFVVLREQGELRVAATHVRPGVRDTGRPSMAVVQRAIDQGREVIVADVDERSDLRDRASVVNMALRSVLCVPLVDGPSTLGAVYVDQTRGSVTDLTRAARFMRALAAHTAVAVGNAHTLRQAQRRAEWAAEAAHDLRGPIATVVSMLGGGPVDPHKAREMKGLAAHAMELADSVLRDGAVERGVMDLSALVHRACVALKHEVHAQGRNLHWSCVPHISVHGVPLDLRRALANLIRNAAKYTPQGAEVQVRLERQRSRAILTVRDQGPGLPVENPQELFQRGTHGADERSGTGLGLAIVAESVRTHGGHLSAANHPDGGAVFTIQLPVMSSDTSLPETVA